MSSNWSEIFSESGLFQQKVDSPVAPLLLKGLSSRQQVLMFRSGAEAQPDALQPGSIASFSQPSSLQKKNKPVHFLCLPAILIPLLSHVFLQLRSSPSSPPFIPPQDHYFCVFDVLLGCRK